jgi:uncharacterized repeat protein (TIGR01451 family)
MTTSCLSRGATLLLAGLGVAGLASPVAGQTLQSAANQNFGVGWPATAISAITVKDAATPVITAANDIRIRIPATLFMSWNTALTTATITGGAAGKVSTTVTYEDGGKTLVLNVTSNFAGGDQITVSGLQYTAFTWPSGPDRLQLVLSGSGGSTAATDSKTITIVGPTITSAANQVFSVGQASTTISSITVQDPAALGTIKAGSNIRIRIPASFNMTWNTALTTATFSGGAHNKVQNPVSYEDGGKTLVVDVISDFAGSNAVTIDGLAFTNFTAPSAADSLELVITGPGGGTAALDAKTITIVAPTFSSAANQTFLVGQVATAMSPLTITDAAGTATITATNDIRIRIPATFNMTWNTAIGTATLTWLSAGPGKIATAVNYEDGGKTLVLNVTTNFIPNDQVVVSGLQFMNFTGASLADHLQLVVSGAGGGTTATDDKTKTVLGNGAAVSPHTTSASQLPSNGTNYTVGFTVQNTGALTDSYDLLTKKRPGTVITTVSISGSGVTQGANPDSARLSNLAASASVAVTVTYTVGNVAAGSQDTLVMTARSVGSSAQKDSGQLRLSVVRPNLTVSKGVSPTGSQTPGTDLTYSMTITNGGTSSAASVMVVDTLRPTVQFKVGSVSTSLPAGISVVVEYSNDGGASWTYVPASGACSAPAAYDRCVTAVRWRLLNSLSATPPDNSGTVSLVASIR